MSDKDSSNYPRYRIMLQIEDVLSGQTYGPEPIELFRTDIEDDVIQHLEGILLELNIIDDPNIIWFTENPEDDG
jgi:hypothetical protein